jgi:glutamate/aspartate transport system substrate-binding protein
MMIRLLLIALLGAPVLAGAQTLDKIRKSGVISLGYIDNAAPFSWLDGNREPQGYSVELCKTVADGIGAQLKRTGLKVRWVKLTIQDRIEAVRSGKVDLECSTTTWTLTRHRLVDFSLVTFVDGGSVLVKGEAAELRRLPDFDGKKIAAITGTTTERALRAALVRQAVKTEIVAVKTRDEGLALLREGQIDGFASDRTSLIGVVVTSGSGGSYKLLDQDFSIEQYALMMKRGDHDFRLAVNRVLAHVYRSREIDKIYARWLGPLGPPSLLLSATYFIQALSE